MSPIKSVTIVKKEYHKDDRHKGKVDSHKDKDNWQKDKDEQACVKEILEAILKAQWKVEEKHKYEYLGDLVKTGICINVNLSCFCEVTCLLYVYRITYFHPHYKKVNSLLSPFEFTFSLYPPKTSRISSTSFISMSVDINCSCFFGLL